MARDRTIREISEPVMSSKADTADQRAREILRRHGLRCTASRLAVLSVLFSEPSTGHLTVQQVIDALDDRGGGVDLATVYRTIGTLVDVGVLHALSAGERAATYGLDDDPHHHAVCTRCGAVSAIPAEQLSAALTLASKGSRFALSPAAGMTLHGLCPQCQAAAE